MHKVYPLEWLRLADPTDQRNQFHLTALHEAQIATEFREATSPTSLPANQPSLVSRLRLALAGGPAVATTEPCNCPA